MSKTILIIALIIIALFVWFFYLSKEEKEAAKPKEAAPDASIPVQHGAQEVPEKESKTLNEIAGTSPNNYTDVAEALIAEMNEKEESAMNQALKNGATPIVMDSATPYDSASADFDKTSAVNNIMHVLPVPPNKRIYIN